MTGIVGWIQPRGPGIIVQMSKIELDDHECKRAIVLSNIIDYKQVNLLNEEKKKKK